MATGCKHLDQIQAAATPRAGGCEECLKTGETWVHLRACEACGHVGCCDDSKNKHATKHFHATAHPVIRSLEPGEHWRWCYVDELISSTDGAGDGERETLTRTGLETDNSLARETSRGDELSASQGIFPGVIDPLRARRDADSDKGMFKTICGKVRRCNRENLEPVIELAVEIAREGREGRRIGTLFTFGDAGAVLERSRPLILDPLAGHAPEAKSIRDPNLRGTIKELAQLDGAFVVSDEGIVISACRYLDAMASDVVLPFGLGSRHVAGGSISQATDAVAIVVSESSMVRVFDDGKLVAEIIPELWLMDRYNVQLRAPYRQERQGDLAVLVTES